MCHRRCMYSVTAATHRLGFTRSPSCGPHRPDGARDAVIYSENRHLGLHSFLEVAER